MKEAFPFKYKLLLAYDGTSYSGWQVQPRDPSIQAAIEGAFLQLFRQKITLIGSGRTDSGVHALEQVAHFCFPTALDPQKLIKSLNSVLPKEIRIFSAAEVPQDFHARFSATGKIYRYYFNADKIQLPFKKLYCYHLPFPIDLDLLEQSIPYFIGTHDFTAFSHEAHKGSASRNAIRTIKRIDLGKEDLDFFLEFEANGFLHKMVRNIVGTLFDIARGKIPLTSLCSIFEEKKRHKAGTTAPSHGLFLIKVLYP